MVKGKKVILLGAGGAARGFGFLIKDEGGDLTIINRTVSDAEELANTVGCGFGGLEKLSEFYHYQIFW